MSLSFQDVDVSHQKNNFRWKWLLIILPLLVGIFPWTRHANAQNNQTAFQIQQFRPWGDPQGLFQSQSAKTLGKWKYTVGLYLNYATDPLTVRFEDSRMGLLEHQFGADLVGGIGVLPWLDLYLAIPMTLYQSGQIPDNAYFDNPKRSLSGFAFSDIKFAIKGQILKEKKQFLNLGLQLYFGFPTGNTDNFNGEDGVSFGFNVLLDKNISIFNIALNLGYRYLPKTEVLNLVINHELTYSLGASMPLLKQYPYQLDVIAEILGATALGDGVSLEGAPFELYVGARYYPLHYKDLAINLGFGIPLFWPGYGTPLFRVMLGVTWTPKKHDRDNDGVLDHDDVCPKVFGAKANKGCPWPDSDKDGLTDNIDKCPKKAGPKANKGCPWPDSDKDGLTDNIDKCPQQAGPKENKGCPDTDRDKDGIVDRLDKCPDVPGTRDRKGCPKKVLVVVTQKAIKILQKIYFRTGRSRISLRSYPLLRQVAQVLKSRPTMKIRIEGHTDNRGSKRFNLRLSERRAKSVRRFLIRLGIAPERMIAKGYGMSRPIDSNRTRRGRARNRRVEFNIISQ